MASERSTAVGTVVGDLQRIFSDRLEAVVAYGLEQSARAPVLALVRTLTLDDLNACAERGSAWDRAGAATPLVLTTGEFARSLDAFPIEYGEIMDRHEIVYGSNPFSGLLIRPEDLRRACEVQVKSHLLHLREDYLETGARRGEIDALVRESAHGFAALLRQLARLDGQKSTSNSDVVGFAELRLQLDGRVVSDLLALADPQGLSSSVDAVKLFPDYLRAMERLAEFVDRWREA